MPLLRKPLVQAEVSISARFLSVTAFQSLVCELLVLPRVTRMLPSNKIKCLLETFSFRRKNSESDGELEKIKRGQSVTRLGRGRHSTMHSRCTASYLLTRRSRVAL